MSAAMSAARGFSLVELLLALSLTVVVMSTAVAIAGEVQRGQARVLEDAAAQQEARFAIDWIARVVAAAGSNAYGITPATVPTCGSVAFAPLHPDPDGNGVHDDLRVQADVNSPNGVLVGEDVLGTGADCDESGEDVTIGIDRPGRVITRRDLASDAGRVPVTDAVFTDLRFAYLTSDRSPAMTAEEIAFVQISLTAESRALNPGTGLRARFTYRREVPVRRQ